MLIQPLIGFVGAITFAYIYRVPAKQRIFAGLVGAVGYTMFLLTPQSWGEIGTVFMGAMAAAICSEILARRRRQPVLVFLIPGVIPLVPGGQAYLTMLGFLQKEYAEAFVSLVSTVLAAGAVAAGIIVASSIFRIYSSTKHARR
ncbi:MAG: threonine/serine exporter [Firmicutes bacterium]|nr:threonine/serine exporter [Bacillota bacterium]